MHNMEDIRLTTMSVTTACPSNGSSECRQEALPGHQIGLAVGLSVFFLVVLLMVAIVFYVKRYHRDVWRLDRRGPGKREDQAQPEQHRYSTMGRAAPGGAVPHPVYENYGGQPAQSTASSGEAHVSPGGLEEDFYYQCDTADDAIYNNDPNCSLAMLPEDGEDPYIIPDSL